MKQANRSWKTNSGCWSPSLIVFIWLALVTGAEAGAYDPLAVLASFNPQPTDLTVEVPERQREIPMRIYLPPGEKYELVLFEAEHSAFTDRAMPGDSETRIIIASFSPSAPLFGTHFCAMMQ